MRLLRDKCVLLIVDVQGKLASLVHEKDRMIERIRRMVLGARALGLPILWTEQIPEKLGPTVPEIADLLTDLKPIEKKAFSCHDNKSFMDAFEALGRHQVLVTGIESHVCIYQTAIDLQARLCRVEVVEDAVSSRDPANKEAALRRLRSLGIGVTASEMVLFELLRTSEAAEFKQILELVK